VIAISHLTIIRSGRAAGNVDNRLHRKDAARGENVEIIDAVTQDAHRTPLQELLTGPYDRATVTAALAFATWQRLTTIEGLSDEQATEVMVRAVAGTLLA
jgi:hypothetical protein